MTFPLPRPSMTRSALFLAVAVGLAAPAATTFAQDDVEDAVVATVNGTDIRYSDLALAEQELAGQLSGLPEAVRMEYLVGLLVDRTVVAQAARKAGLADDEEVKLRVGYYTEKALGDVYLSRQTRDEVTDAEAKEFYDKQVAGLELEEEVRARHILVETEEEANAVLKRLGEGEAFEDVAKDVSTGPSAERGGDLGYFTKDRMVPEFAEVAFAMQPGEVSQPVKTQFGWHIIKVEDRREQQVVAFEDVKDELKSQLSDQKMQALVTKLREEADVQFHGASNRPQLAPQQ